MKTKLVLGLLLLAGLPFLLDACKDHQTPNAGITFQSTGDEVKESDGTISSFNPQIITNATGRIIPVVVTLDRDAASKAVVSYSISGTATRDVAGTPGDYDIDGDDSQLTFDQGSSTDTIKIRLYEDLEFEYDTTALNEQGISYETIILTLESVDSGPVMIGDQNEYTLKIDEDDAVILLSWDSGDGTAGDVDMDEILWEGGSGLLGSANPGPSFEGLNIPAGLPDDTYGMSYTYYAGSSDNVTFDVYMANFGGTLNKKTELDFTGHLSQANINVWDDSTSVDYKGKPIVVQTMNKKGFNYTSVSGITKPSSGSRLSAPALTRNQRERLLSALHAAQWKALNRK